MSFKEVKELRKSGKLEEALTMANQDLEKEPANIWNKRSIAWVYHDYLKEYATKDNFEKFMDFINKLKALELPADEKMIFDTCAYQIGKLIFSFANDEHLDYSKVNSLFENIKTFHFTKPSESYSFLYKAFHKCHKNWTNYLQFADWWGFDNFSSQDYLTEEFKGKKIMSIVEQAYIAYSKKILEGNKLFNIAIAEKVKLPNGRIIDNSELIKKIENGTVDIPGGYTVSIDKNIINIFLPKLDKIIEVHPEYQYPPYFKAKLLLALGNEEDVLTNFIPFAKKKRNDFWVWELLADTFQPEDERKMACLCKALSLKTPDEFLINTRQKLAEILIKQGKFQEAKTEIEKILLSRNKNKWKIPVQILEWTAQNWFYNNEVKQDNFTLYKKYTGIAEEILYADIPEEVVVVEFVNSNKTILNFVKDTSKFGFFSYSEKIVNPKIGDLLAVRFVGQGQNGFFKILSAKRIKDDIEIPAIKLFSGELKIKELANFGFVNNIFVSPELITRHKLQNNSLVEGRAVLSFHKKKNDWQWKAVEIN